MNLVTQYKEFITENHFIGVNSFEILVIEIE